MPKVYNKRHNTAPSGAVYVGRPSPFGNPFGIKSDSLAKFKRTTSRECINEFRKYLLNNPKLLAKVKSELKGKDLICWCKPDPCHADILLEVANAEELEN